MTETKTEVKPYTLIYVDSWMSGSHKQYLTRLQRVTTNDIAKVCKAYDGSIQYIFEGHPKLQGDFEDPRLEVEELIY